MSRLLNIALFLGALSFAVIGATGVDLVGSRTGVGLIGLGVSGLLLTMVRLVKPGIEGRPWLIISVLLGGGYFIWRAMTAGPVGLAVPDLILMLVFLGIYLLVSSSGKGARPYWLSILAMLAVVNVGVAVAQAASGNTFYVWQAATEIGGFTGGLFGHYNAFASFLNGSVFFFLSYLFFGRNLLLRSGCGLLSVGLIVALVLSSSRGGWVSFIVGGSIWMVLVILYLRQRKSKMVGVAAIALVLLGVGGVVSSFWVVQKITDKRVEKYNDETGRTASGRAVTGEVVDGGRLAFQQMAFEVFLDAPVTGKGPRAFSYLALENWDPDSLELWMGDPEFAHNEYLQVLSDYGLIGFLIIILLVFVHGVLGVTSFLKGDQGDPVLSLWQVGAAGGLVAVLCQSYFSFLFHFPACVALVALQLGILVSRPVSTSRTATPAKASGRIVAVLGLGVAGGLLFLGGHLSLSYLRTGVADQELATAATNDDLLRGLDTLEDAGKLGWDPKIYEVVARRAMSEANAAVKRGQPAEAKILNLRAKAALESALKLNPHFSAALAGLPRVEDALGNHAAAEDGHQKAMKAIWARENSLRPHFHAARSSYLQALKSDDNAATLALLREAERRVLKRREILNKFRELPLEKELRLELEAWISSHEARRLFLRGNDVWMNARPRNPELAYALLLEAQKRYQRAEKVVSDKEPRWEKELEQLEINLGYLKAGQFLPAALSEEEIAEVIATEAGLDSAPTTR
ncbi:MAG: O-antigen ligase [Akkermansiaceae bacterium]|jgi:O-antigen ligase